MNFSFPGLPMAEQTRQIHEQGYTSAQALLDKGAVEAMSRHCLKIIWSPQSKSGDQKIHYRANTRHKYGDAKTDRLLECLADKIGEICGRSLIPAYSFFRFYPQGSGMKPHRDRAACEYSASLCLATNYDNLIESQPDYQWPLFCNGAPMYCRPGDAILYKGCEVTHWREPLQGNFQLQLFLHYVDANGPFAETHGYDGRRALGCEKEAL